MTIDLTSKKILIIKLRYIGDTLSIIPVIDSINKTQVRVTVDVMVNKGTEEVLQYHPYIRKIWKYDRKQARKNIISAISYHLQFIKKIRAERYDVLIDFTHGDRAAFISFISGSPIRITYQDSSSLSHILMNRFIESNRFEKHIVDHQLESLKYFGINSFVREMSIHIPRFLEQKMEYVLSASSLNHDKINIIIHPGAKNKLRRWKPQYFAEIINMLKEKYNPNIFLLGGPDEGDIIKIIKNMIRFPIEYSSNELSLLEMAAVIKRCNLFIGNDSAPGHISAAVGCPSLVLFGPTFPSMWRPLSAYGEVIFKNVQCCGCKQIECIHPNNNCMDLIQVKEVWNKVEELINPNITSE